MQNRRPRRLFSGLATGCATATVLAAALAHADVVYVNHAATGADDGTSWSSAFTNLRAALEAAGPGDEIWVAAGTYRPAPPGGSRSLSFELKIGVPMYGGFSGTETAREQRDWQSNVTILSGDLNGDDGPDFANTHENSYQVVRAYGVDSSAVLDGFTIAHGRCDGPGLGPVPASLDQGSGINIYFSLPLIRNCTLLRNWSFNHGAVNDHGGGTFENCEFRENFSYQFGAGLYVHNDVTAFAIGCRFFDNRATTDGGGAYSRSAHGAMLVDCVFDGNQADRGAGMYHAPGGNTIVTDSHFSTNTAIIGGGGLYSDLASPTIERCTFWDNRAGAELNEGDGGGGQSGGGGTYCDGGEPALRDCVFHENTASFGGGAYFIFDSLGEVTDCVFSGNHAREAGGLYTLGSAVLIERCRFLHNRADGGSFSVGGGISNYFSGATIRDCTFDGNVAELGGGGAYCEGEQPLIVGCVFRGNEAFGEFQGWGGGLLNGFHTFVTIANCVFSGNVAHEGGGFFDMFAATTTATNNTFVGNVATRDGGGAIYGFENSTTTIANSILWNNLPDEIAGLPPSVRYSCVRGGHPGIGNVSSDPLLIDPAGPDGYYGTPDDDPRLARGSPCIDAGSNFDVPTGVLVDAAQMPRFADDPATADGGAGDAPIVDMGAFEWQPCPGDVDGDGDADLSDLTRLLSNFGLASGAARGDGDLDGDGDVDLADLTALLARFGLSCD